MKKMILIFGVLLFGIFLMFGCTNQENTNCVYDEENCAEFITDCPECAVCPEPTISPLTFCDDPLIMEVHGDSEGNFVVSYQITDGRSDVYLVNGTIISCSNLIGVENNIWCGYEGWVYTVCTNIPE